MFSSNNGKETDLPTSATQQQDQEKLPQSIKSVPPTPCGLNTELFAQNYKALLSYNGDDISDEDFVDYVAIRTILDDESIFAAGLDKLEALVKEHAKAKGILDNSEQKAILMDQNNKKRFKLLSDVLYDWAVANKFGLVTAKINAELPPNTFKSILKDGILFKDNGAGQAHGAWTHFIQVFIVFNYDKDNATLKNKFHDLYKMLGTDSAKSKSYGLLWKNIFDRLHATRPNEFSEPENVQHYIVSNSIRYPFLSVILRKEFKIKAGAADVTYKDQAERAKRLR